MEPIWIILIVVFAFLLLAGVGYYVLTHPANAKDKLKKYTVYKYAHRGLHDEAHAENSMSAFRLAAESGFGIELDVRLSRDGEVVVFHDDTLKRVAGDERAVIDLTAEELSHMRLSGTDEGVPTLREVLEMVGGRVPILVEIKRNSPAHPDVTPRAIEILKEYEGDYLLQSFNPLSVGVVRELAPEVPRGFLASHLTKKKGEKHPLYQYLVERFFLNIVARPEFLAYDHNDYKKYLPVRTFSAIYKMPTFAWTVRNEEEAACAMANGFDTVIFENYVPKTKRNDG